jgi:hypothetical protein
MNEDLRFSRWDWHFWRLRIPGFPDITCRHQILEDHDHVRDHRAGYDNKDNFDVGVSEKLN